MKLIDYYYWKCIDIYAIISMNQIYKDFRTYKGLYICSSRKITKSIYMYTWNRSYRSSVTKYLHWLFYNVVIFFYFFRKQTRKYFSESIFCHRFQKNKFFNVWREYRYDAILKLIIDYHTSSNFLGTAINAHLETKIWCILVGFNWRYNLEIRKEKKCKCKK